MDWLRQVPIGQYAAGSSGWLRLLDPRLKFAWVLMFLLTPVLAGPSWRVSLVIALFVLTFISSIPRRVWSRSLSLLILLALIFGGLSMFLPTGDQSPLLNARYPEELDGLKLIGPSWELLNIGPLRVGAIVIGPLIVVRRSAELGVNTATLIFTVVHSVNLMLLTTPPEELVWALSWFMSPLAYIRAPVDRISFQLLLALRFLPLVQEELQNLLRSLAIRAVNLKELGFKASVGLLLSVGERLIANILLRAEQGADALLVRGGYWLSPEQFRPEQLLRKSYRWLNISSGILLFLVLFLRRKYGAF
ncbi:CbiQ family ECF transporter T component [Prochlorococcus sp. MIT 1341]|uniref:CbiQ family ECF transporter T component n=1 Tax=Prochlorococcus sp. MIT 1341 TaxID=3096221 RepID=UPI002A759EF0|nr:CbiQ family ECF transporter T component [Prochlorococcus sp. MIT 1341]